MGAAPWRGRLAGREREAGDPGAEQERGRDKLGHELCAMEESWSLEQRKGTELC
jgi:hypothetical protein